ncbi:hypothetical protein LCGC14_2286910 [marine sediment metagenome]|uniref:Uncharacterized protein n=1 Tax=marine sediment metagenome TaxID=412755 RepID=A0A0F9F510_9ZZZZ
MKERKPFALDRKTIDIVFRGGNDWPVMVATLRWPSPDAFRELYRHIWTDHRLVGGRLEAVEPPTDYAKFFAEHLKNLRRADGEELLTKKDTIQRWRDWFLEHRESRVPAQVINFQLIAAELKKQSIGGGFSLESLDARGIRLFQFEYFGSAEIEGTTVEKNGYTEVVLHVSPASVKDEESYNAAITATFNPGGGKREVVDPIGFTSVFKARIERIENATFKGEPCEAGNKADWIDHVPYHWIIKTLVEDHRGSTAANFTRVSGKRSKPTG